MGTFIVIVLVVFIFLVLRSFKTQPKKEEMNERRTYESSVKPTSGKSTPSFPCVRQMEVKGTFYRSNDEKAAARFVEVGNTLVLVPEPDNPVSPNAIKVCTIEGDHIGYVNKEISKFVGDNLSHVASCKVTKVSADDIPFITAVIKFSPLTCKQPEFIKKELRVRPERKLRDLAKMEDPSTKDENVSRKNELPDYKFSTAVGLVEGTYELPKDVVNKAKSLRQGDKLVLMKPEPMQFYPNRLDVYTEDKTMIGFIYGNNPMARNIYNIFDKIHSAIVESPMDAYSHGNLGIRVFYPEGCEGKQNDPGISISIIQEFTGPYPQLGYVDQIKRTDTAKALEIAVPIADKENGIDAKFLCCQCYRLLKDYDSEREMILRILNYIQNLKPEDVSENEYISITQRMPEMKKRLATVESRLESKSKKKS